MLHAKDEPQRSLSSNTVVVAVMMEAGNHYKCAMTNLTNGGNPLAVGVSPNTTSEPGSIVFGSLNHILLENMRVIGGQIGTVRAKMDERHR